tara:strand:- start:58 stop:399 length:342 start_codon:yes stop_codon:yes gene_type:complete
MRPSINENFEEPESFDHFIGDLVFQKLLTDESLIDYSPFIIVTVTYEIGTNDIVPQSFITGYEEFEEAVIDMDLIEADEDLFSDIGWDLTVLEMYHVGDTVVWKNKLPMTPVA